jgi:hypothetical protein
MIPDRLAAYQEMFPVLQEATHWQLLRKWSLSEVYRMTTKLGETRIVKWGGDEMAGEAAIYSELLVPLRIRSPIIYDCCTNEHGGLFIMEDAGPFDLEQAPQAAYFIEAVRELARLRSSATENLSLAKVSKLSLNKHIVTAEHFLQQLDDLERASTESSIHIVKKALILLPERIKQLYQEVPFTLVHHDYQAKNLLIQEDHILPIDWSNAYLSPHLGDLHRLICEAYSMSNVPTNEMLEAYLDELGSNEMKMEQLICQVKIGGICWLIRTLRWLVYGGTDTIPGAIDWLPDIFADLDKLLEQLDKSDLYV